jgi:hypothetical protein
MNDKQYAYPFIGYPPLLRYISLEKSQILTRGTKNIFTTGLSISLHTSLRRYANALQMGRRFMRFMRICTLLAFNKKE